MAKEIKGEDIKTVKTLSDDDIVSSSNVSRRSTLRMLGAGVLGAAVTAAIGLRPSTAQAQGVSDSDSGPSGDSPGHGRSGCSDSDNGPNEDRPAHGRSCSQPRRPCSDSDSGPNADGAGHGRSCR